MRYLVPVARCLLASIFVLAAPGHFQAQTIGYVSQQGVPFAQVVVPLSGLMALAGGISVLLGWRARVGAWMLVAFLVAVTPTMHAFWAVSDPAMRMTQFLFFMKNVGMLGGLLLIAYWGAGPVSLDERADRPATEASSVKAILGEGLPSGSLPRGSARRVRYGSDKRGPDDHRTDAATY